MFLLPHLLGPSGIWLSMPASETLALLSIILFYLLTKRQSLQNQPV
ncbi:MAG: hypothetical protein LIP03_14385 [Bacteroidales bacterium]|nr:hypothetical protein [Bacteroidales bacterium]